MRIHERINSAKRKLADHLNEKVNGLSISHRRLTLVLFGLLFASICIVQVIRSLRAREKDDSFSVEQITLPESIHKRFPEKGYRVLDSLIHKAPGLMDSVNMLVKKYQSH